MATFDVYAISFHQQFLGQSLFNEFFYQQTSVDEVDTEAQDLTQAFSARFVTDAGSTLFENAAFSNDLNAFAVRTLNLFNPFQIGSNLIGGLPQGGNTATNDTPQSSYRITSPRKRADMRNGNKYFGGICNGSAINGIVVPTIMDLLGDLADGLGQPLTFTGTGYELVFHPVIVKRVREGAGTDEDPYTYRLPTNIDEYEGYLADNWVASEVLTTQNRRKLGRGV